MLETVLIYVACGLSLVAAGLGVVALLWSRSARQGVSALTPSTQQLLATWKELAPQEAADELASYLEQVSRTLHTLERRTTGLEANLPTRLSRQAVVRFDNTEEVRGKLSFCLALLNEQHDGFLLTSLYNLEGCRVFLRPVSSGQVEHEMLEEEAQALAEALS
jgi:hypothetical protein